MRYFIIVYHSKLIKAHTLGLMSQDINSIGKLLISDDTIREAQKKNRERLEFDYMLENSMSAISSALFVCLGLFLFLGFTALGMRKEAFDVFWGIYGGYAFFVCFMIIRFGISREPQRISSGLAFLRTHGNAAEATNTNTFEKELSDGEDDTSCVLCYEYTFPAILATGKTALIRTKLIGDPRENNPMRPMGNRMRIKYAAELPALCCREISPDALLPIQGIGLIVVVSGLLWFGLALWSIDNLIAPIAAIAAQGEYQLSSISDWFQMAVSAAEIVRSYPVEYIWSALFMLLGSLSFTLYGIILTIPPSSRKFRRTIDSELPAAAAYTPDS